MISTNFDTRQQLTLSDNFFNKFNILFFHSSTHFSTSVISSPLNNGGRERGDTGVRERSNEGTIDNSFSVSVMAHIQLSTIQIRLDYG